MSSVSPMLLLLAPKPKFACLLFPSSLSAFYLVSLLYEGAFDDHNMNMRFFFFLNLKHFHLQYLSCQVTLPCVNLHLIMPFHSTLYAFMLSLNPPHILPEHRMCVG